MIFTAKTQSNAESTVGVMTLAGDMYDCSYISVKLTIGRR